MVTGQKPCEQERQIFTRLCVYPCEDKVRSLSTDEKGLIKSICHQVASRYFKVMMPYQELNTGLCCWQVEYSAGAVARINLNELYAAKSMLNLYPWLHVFSIAHGSIV